MRGRGILGPWELWRKIALGLVVVVCVFLYVILMIPVGFVMLGILIGAAYVWKGLEMTNVNQGMYMGMTFPYRLATFFVSLKGNLRQLLTPVTLGFGSPTDDEDHEVTAGMTPFARLSSYWAALAAFLLAIPDIFLTAAHFPIWGTDFLIPGFISYPFSVIGWFVAIQMVLATRRTQGDKDSIAAVEPRPAVMVNKSRAELPFSALLPKAALYGSGPAVLLLLVGIFARLPILLTIGIVLLALLIGLGVAASKLMTAQYIVGWEKREERREFWTNAFSFMRDKIPAFSVEMELPSFEEHQSTQMQRKLQRDRIARARRNSKTAQAEAETEEEFEEPYDPQVHMATLGYPPGTTFEDYKDAASKLANSLGVEICAVSPIGNITSGNEEVSGTVGSAGFRVWWTHSDPPALLEPNIDPWMRELLVRARVIPALARVKGIGHCTMYTCTMITRPESRRQIMEIKIIPPVGVGLKTFFANLNSIQDALGVEWVRVRSTGDEKNAQTSTPAIALYIGAVPTFDRNEMSFVRPPAVQRDIIDKMDWQYYWSTLNIQTQAGGFPVLTARIPSTDIVDKMVFSLPMGLSYDLLPAKLPTIATTSGYQFMEIEQGNEATLKGMSQEERIAAEESQQAAFTIIASRKDPLKRVFNFMDYKDQILPGRVPGKEKISWSPGVMADDSLAIYEWDAEEPHLLIAGASGSGKSVVASAAILQLAYNNGPGEVNFWMIEPKNEMQAYRNLDITKRFVDSWSPDEEFIKNSADLMWDARVEMDNRNKTFSSHPKAPKKLSKARDIAIAESEKNGTPLEDHPLYLPYIFIFLEECATLFAESANKEEKDEQKRLLTNTAEIARKARSAGIYLICLTQYPTNASIPSVIRQQMRRIGLKCQNDMASRVVIEENGLEKIKTKGVGMISQNGNYRSFRGFLVQDNDPDSGKPNDILSIIAGLPSNAGNASVSTAAGAPRRVILPKPDQSVFNIWDAEAGKNLFSAIGDKQKTNDVTFKDMGYSAPKDPSSLDAVVNS